METADNLGIIEMRHLSQVPLPLHSFVIVLKSSEAPSPTSQCDGLSGDILFRLSISDAVKVVRAKFEKYRHLECNRQPVIDLLENKFVSFGLANLLHPSQWPNEKVSYVRYISFQSPSGKFYERIAWPISSFCGCVLWSMWMTHRVEYRRDWYIIFFLIL